MAINDRVTIYVYVNPDTIMKDMKSVIDEYSAITVADLEDITGERIDIDNKQGLNKNRYGWVDINDAHITYLCDERKSIISLPRPIRIDDGISLDEACNGIDRITSALHEQKDVVNHPSHYKAETGLETIDVIEAFTFDLKGIEAVSTANILKYVCRWKKKNGLEDLKKAKWYLDHLINHVEKLEEENKQNEKTRTFYKNE